MHQTNIAKLLVAAGRTSGNSPAVSLGQNVVWNYAEFSESVASLAAGLRALPGMQVGDRVALVMGNCPQYLQLLWACWHAGLCAVPVNARLHAKEIAFILEDTSAKWAFITTDHLADMVPLLNEIESLSQVLDVESQAYQRMCDSPAVACADVPEDAPAWLFYTSGTTGRPKGAMLSHRNLLAMSWRHYADFGQVSPGDCMIHAAPLSHGSGLMSVPHAGKAGHHVIPASRGFDLDELFTLIQHYREIAFFAAPTMLMRLVDHPAAATAPWDHVKAICYGGAPMYLEDSKHALSRVGPRMWQGYGQGESPITITSLDQAAHADTAHPRYEERLASVGVARTGVELRVVDAAGDDVPIGAIGEIIVRSDVTMTGYWNNPKASAEVLRGGWLYTGDMGVLSEDGYLTLKDRSKDMIISGGMNIYPREIEEVLLRHPYVSECSVTGRASVEWGEEVVAFVVRQPNKQVSEVELDELCLAHIARFKRPKHYVFLQQLPKSSYGKVLKSALREFLPPAIAVLPTT